MGGTWGPECLGFERIWGLRHGFLGVVEPMALDTCVLEWGRLGTPKLVRGWALGWEWLGACISMSLYSKRLSF